MKRAEALKCRTVRSLNADAVESGRLPATLWDHVSTCLRCQAQVVRSRKLRRELAALASEVDPAPASVLLVVEGAICMEPRHDVAKRSAKLVATVAGATAAAASLAVAWWRRSRAIA